MESDLFAGIPMDPLRQQRAALHGGKSSQAARTALTRSGSTCGVQLLACLSGWFWRSHWKYFFFTSAKGTVKASTFSKPSSDNKEPKGAMAANDAMYLFSTTR